MSSIATIQPRPHSYRIDNIIVDEYGEKIGAIGIAIYNVLARHADRSTGICWPSIQTICKKLKLGRTTVKKYLRILAHYDLIAVIPQTSAEGDPTTNRYIVLDPTPEQRALREKQREALFTSHKPEQPPLPEGRSLSDPPPALPFPEATDPRPPADPKQVLENKILLSSATNPMRPDRRATCHHPEGEISFLSNGLIICHHCYGMLDHNLKLIDESAPPEEVHAA